MLTAVVAASPPGSMLIIYTAAAHWCATRARAAACSTLGKTVLTALQVTCAAKECKGTHVPQSAHQHVWDTHHRLAAASAQQQARFTWQHLGVHARCERQAVHVHNAHNCSTHAHTHADAVRPVAVWQHAQTPHQPELSAPTHLSVCTAWGCTAPWRTQHPQAACAVNGAMSPQDRQPGTVMRPQGTRTASLTAKK